MNNTLPLYSTNPIKAGDDLEEGSSVFRPVLTSPNMGVFTVDKFRFGVFVQSGTVGPYVTSSGTPFCNFGGTMSDPTASPHFRTEEESEAWIVEQIQKAREELQDQIAEVMAAAKIRQEASNCCHKKTECEKGACAT